MSDINKEMPEHVVISRELFVGMLQRIVELSEQQVSPPERIPLIQEVAPSELSFDPSSREILVQGESTARLSHLQGRVFEPLVCHPDTVHTYKQIRDVGWPDEVTPSGIDMLIFERLYYDRRRIQAVVSKIRGRLKSVDPELDLRLENIPVRGYRWNSQKRE